MKKLICVVLVMFVMLGSLTACNVTQNMSGALAGDAEATPKAKEMIAALTEDRLSDAKELMHPQVAGKTDAALTQMRDYLDGRETKEIEQISLNTTNSTGTSGKTRQERVVYKVTLADDTVVYLNVVYSADNLGTGFVSFQLVLGVV